MSPTVIPEMASFLLSENSSTKKNTLGSLLRSGEKMPCSSYESRDSVAGRTHIIVDGTGSVTNDNSVQVPQGRGQYEVARKLRFESFLQSNSSVSNEKVRSIFTEKQPKKARRITPLPSFPRLS